MVVMVVKAVVKSSVRLRPETQKGKFERRCWWLEFSYTEAKCVYSFTNTFRLRQYYSESKAFYTMESHKQYSVTLGIRGCLKPF